MPSQTDQPSGAWERWSKTAVRGASFDRLYRRRDGLGLMVLHESSRLRHNRGPPQALLRRLRQHDLPQFLECCILNLTHPLSANTVLEPDFIERAGGFA